MTTDLEQTITSAQTPENFDVFAFLDETVYPTEDVTVYRDVVSAKRYTELKREQDASDEEKGVDNSKELAALADKIKKSGMTFTLRGLAPYEVEQIVGEDAPKGEYPFFQDHVLIARSIVSVKDAKGNPDSRTWTDADVSKMRGLLTGGEFAKLIVGTSNVNFTAAVFNQATDAGFPG